MKDLIKKECACGTVFTPSKKRGELCHICFHQSLDLRIDDSIWVDVAYVAPPKPPKLIKSRRCKSCGMVVGKGKHYCSECKRSRLAERYRNLYHTDPKRREYILRATRQWQQCNPDKNREIVNAAVKRYYARNREFLLAMARERYKRKKELQTTVLK